MHACHIDSSSGQEFVQKQDGESLISITHRTVLSSAVRKRVIRTNDRGYADRQVEADSKSSLSMDERCHAMSKESPKRCGKMKSRQTSEVYSVQEQFNHLSEGEQEFLRRFLTPGTPYRLQDEEDCMLLYICLRALSSLPIQS